jgi:hypothetical protein
VSCLLPGGIPCTVLSHKHVLGMKKAAFFGCLLLILKTKKPPESKAAV